MCDGESFQTGTYPRWWWGFVQKRGSFVCVNASACLCMLAIMCTYLHLCVHSFVHASGCACLWLSVRVRVCICLLWFCSDAHYIINDSENMINAVRAWNVPPASRLQAGRSSQHTPKYVFMTGRTWTKVDAMKPPWCITALLPSFAHLRWRPSWSLMEQSYTFSSITSV